MLPRLGLVLLLSSPAAVFAAGDAPAAQVSTEAVRGQVRFDVTAHREWLVSSDAGDVFTLPHKARRWGRYTVRVSYASKVPAEAAFQVAGKPETMVKAKLPASAGKGWAEIGTVYLAQGGPMSLTLSLPKGSVAGGFALHEVVLVPAPEGGEVAQAADGSVLLLAKDATTFSENMRYEPNPVKNCLGFWSEKDDFAEWSFTVTKPGKFAVTVHQGNGAAGGSEVAVVSGSQRLDFVVKATGGYQKWQAVPVGEMSFEKAGVYRLAVRPQKKVGGAVMDIQKIELKPL